MKTEIEKKASILSRIFTFIGRKIIAPVLSTLWGFLKNEYKKNPQIMWIPIFLGIWAISVPILRWIDPTSGIFDAGIFQIPIYTAILFIVFMFIAWQTIKITFGELFRYAKEKFKEDFQKLSEWEKIRLYYSVFFAVLFALVLLARVLIITPIS
jgi:hypothetical protein